MHVILAIFIEFNIITLLTHIKITIDVHYNYGLFAVLDYYASDFDQDTLLDTLCMTMLEMDHQNLLQLWVTYFKVNHWAVPLKQLV